MLRWIALALACALPAAAQEGREPVDLELVLLADATGSIDPTETRLQRQGYADAMADPEVLWAIRNGGSAGRIAVTYVEWAGVGSQDIVVGWMVVDGEATARGFGAALLAAPRRAFGSQAIGAALIRGLDLIESNAFEGDRKVIDLSGDSSWNPSGPTLATARDAVLGAGIVINGLAVLCRPPCSGRPRFENLEAEYAGKIIGGPGSFVVTADGEQSFAQAVRRKLILEIADAG
jgi:GNAT superfamily N-acetyltransferase